VTITKRIGISYALIAAVSVIIIIFFGYHEFVTERAEFDARGYTDIHRDLAAEILIVSFFGAMPLILGLGWWWIHHVLAPLRGFTAAIENIQADNLRTPLPQLTRGDEVEKLANVFNSMIERLDQSFRRIHEFTLHASHELKTPLTVMRAQLETALRDGKRASSSDTGWIESQLDEVQRLANIVDSLTLLTKADAGLVALDRKPVPLNEIVQEAFEDALILAQAAGVKVTLEACEDAVVFGDRHRLRQLLLILSDNAVKYNHPGGNVSISLRINAGFAELKITNTGEGIAQGTEGRLFERFARGDNANGKVEGCGLGLAIARWIVQEKGGTIALRSEPDGKTTAFVRLPLYTGALHASEGALVAA
jgi:signal transduction histidine kinase